MLNQRARKPEVGYKISYHVQKPKSILSSSIWQESSQPENQQKTIQSLHNQFRPCHEIKLHDEPIENVNSYIHLGQEVYAMHTVDQEVSC